MSRVSRMFAHNCLLFMLRWFVNTYDEPLFMLFICYFIFLLFVASLVHVSLSQMWEWNTDMKQHPDVWWFCLKSSSNPCFGARSLTQVLPVWPVIRILDLKSNTERKMEAVSLQMGKYFVRFHWGPCCHLIKLPWNLSCNSITRFSYASMLDDQSCVLLFPECTTSQYIFNALFCQGFQILGIVYFWNKALVCLVIMTIDSY